MKGIFAVSIMAIMVATSVRAEIASEAYVKPASDGTHVLTTNTTGQNLTALDTAIKTNQTAIEVLNDDATRAGSVAKSIADAVGNIGDSTVGQYMESVSGTSGSALKDVVANGASAGNVVTAITKDANNDVSVTKSYITSSHIAADAGILKSQLAGDVQTSLGKADSAYQSGDIAQTYSSSSAAPISGVGVANAISGLNLGGTYDLISHNHGSDKITSMGSYTTTNVSGDIAATDSLDTAVAKVEVKVDAVESGINTLNADASTSGSVLNTMAAAKNALDVNALANGNGALTNVTEENGVISNNYRALVANGNIASNAAIGRNKLDTTVKSQLTSGDTSLQNVDSTNPETPGKYALVKDSTGMKWELISRTGLETTGSTTGE